MQICQTVTLSLRRAGGITSLHQGHATAVPKGGEAVAVLGAALVVNPKQWVQARAYALGGYFIALTTFGPFLYSLLDTSDWNASPGTWRAGPGVVVGGRVPATDGHRGHLMSGEVETRPCLTRVAESVHRSGTSRS